MIQRHFMALRLALMAADAISAIVVFVAVSFVRFGSTNLFDTWRRLGLDPWLVAMLYALVWVGALWLQRHYILRAHWSIRGDLESVARATVVVALATFSILFVLKLEDVSRLFLVLLFPAQAVATIVVRVVLRWLLAAARSRGLITRSMLVVGTSREANEFANRLARHTELGMRVIGHLEVPDHPGEDAEQPGERPILGSIEDIEEVLHSHVVDEVAICLPVRSWDKVEPITRLCQAEGKIVRIPMDLMDLAPGGQIDEFDGQPVLSVLYGPDRVLGLAAKRVLDVVVSALCLILLSPLFIWVALWIRFAEGPPVLFRQTRIGLHGRAFTLLKFRTMINDAEERMPELAALNEIDGHAFKLTNDPRLTRTGRFLRRTSLDELPQLWNVLRGHMSLVGPRPPLPTEVANYDVWHRRRLSMKPGMTGAWQVSARREPDFDRWVELDLDYIDRWSLWLDLSILVRTLPALLMPTGR